MKNHSFFFLFLFFFPLIASGESSFTIDNEKKEKPIIVVIPSYNNKDWYERNLESIIKQNYTNFKVIYIDDASIDGTGQFVEDYLQTHAIDYEILKNEVSPSQNIEEAWQNTHYFSSQSTHESFFLLVRNIFRLGAIENLYHAYNTCDDESIIVTVDGDDWLAHPDVFSELNDFYSKNKVWYTHGMMSEYPSNSSWRSSPISPVVIKNRTFRQSYCPSHLRTFYSWLFKRIKLEDFLFEGKFLSMTCDKAIMFPIAEMAGDRHAFISKISYIYNTSNQINDMKVDGELQLLLDGYIRGKKPYSLIN
jgi:glycosyltransferase involved in cell wall biosynthesis